MVICQFRGVVTSYQAADISRNDVSSTLRVGEALAHVQGFGLKAIAVVLVRLTNSPAARVASLVAVLFLRMGSAAQMENYNFWQDFFDTYQSLSDLTKVLWLVVPPASLLGLIALVLRFRLDSKRADHGIDGELIYSIHRDDQNQFHVF